MPGHDSADSITANIDSTISDPTSGFATDPASRKRWARARAGRKRAQSANTASQEAMRRKAKKKALAGV